MENQANLGVWEDPHGPWSEQEPSLESTEGRECR